MDFRSLLQSMTSLSEAETKVTKTGKVHKGDYGTAYDGDDEKKPAAPTEKRGRGRPKKGADDSGEVKSYDTKSLGSVFGGGQKPKKDIGTVSKKHSLKEYIEEAEEAIQEGMTSQAPIQIKPASQTQTQVIQQGDKTLGTVSNPQLAAQIKQSIGKGEMTLNPDEEMSEEVDMGQADAHKSAKSEPTGDWDKDFREKLKQFTKELAQHQAHKEHSMSESKKKPDANKNGIPDYAEDGKGKNDLKKKKVDESISLSESPETLQHIVSKYKHEVKNFIKGEDLDHDLYEALFDYYFNAGEIPYGTAKGRDGDPYEWISDRFDQDVHQYVVDESAVRDFRIDGVKPTNDFSAAGGSMAVPRTAPSVAPTQKEQTPWSVDPINAATDRVGSFISSLGKKNSTFEGTDMKDMQLESWASQLDSLLTEGITVSSSQGQQGAPDSVSVTATDNDAQSLMSVLRNAGIGGFGAGEQQPEIGYGVVQGGEEDFNGTGTEPQPSPDVVGDGDDMLSLIKKMTGINDAPEQGGQDYEDETGALEPASDEESHDDEEADSDDTEEEQTDEGNAFTGKLKQTPKGSEFKMGEKSYKDTSSLEEEHDHDEEESCNECGMYESECGCEHEQVEENYANSSNDPVDAELMKLKALLSMGNDLHKMKTDQTVGNPTRVSVRESLNEWKKLSGL